jgi:hypothetical protein
VKQVAKAELGSDCRLYGLYGVAEFFITTAVRTSDPTQMHGFIREY